MSKMGSVCLVAAGLGLLVVMPGCAWLVAPPPEAVLFGTWDLTPDATTDLEQLQLTFDGDGVLTLITYRVTDSIPLTVLGPPSQTIVDEYGVTVVTTFSGNGLVFTGQLQGTTPEQINGNLTALISVGSVVVSIDYGAATMTPAL